MKKKIFRKITPIVIIILLIGTMMLPSTSSSKEKKPDELIININNLDETTININVLIPDIKTDIINTESGSFTSFQIPNEAYTTITGEAKLPVIRRTIEIPEKADLEIEIISVSWEKTSLKELRLPDSIIPVQPEIIKTKEQKESEFVIDKEYYSTDNYMQTETVKIIEKGKIRQRNFALLEIQPIQYNPATGQIKTMEKCEIQIKINKADIAQTYENIQKYQSSSFEEIFKNIFANYGFYEKNVKLDSDPVEYLIITYDLFYEEIQPFAVWKENLGFNVTLTNTSNIPGGPTKDNIYAYIENAYINWNEPPTYVLLVGDSDQIPTYIGTVGYTAADLYYETMDSDIYPDIMLGRFPASQESHVTAMVDKTIYYEQGDFANASWIKKAAFMAGNHNHHISEGTHNYVISTYLDPNNYTCDKIYEETYGATTQDITDALNDGRSLAIYSGHGSRTSWSDGPQYTQTDVRNLINQDIYPFVCSHACITGDFTLDECFAETWLREANKAALVFWGSSHNTYWDPDDVLEKEMFEAWWDDGLETIGGMTDQALYEHYQYQSGGYYGELYYECYNIFGDPSIKIYREEPGPEELKITTTEENWNFISLPFKDTVYKNEIYVMYNDEKISFVNATTNKNPTGNPMIDQNFFGWNRTTQSYVLSDFLQPWEGYWMFSYIECELWAENILITQTDNITELEQNWNIIGVPIENLLSKTELIIEYNGNDYTWTQATTNNNPTGSPLIDPNFFGWNNTQQSYEFTDTFTPGMAYWIFSYQQCNIKI